LGWRRAFALAVWSNSEGGRATTLPLLYLWLVFGLAVVEMVTLLEPWRRNPRYLVMALPLFYLMVAAAWWIANLYQAIGQSGNRESGNQRIRNQGNGQSGTGNRESGMAAAPLVMLMFGVVQAGCWCLICASPILP
jgi:hypothetical protein